MTSRAMPWRRSAGSASDHVLDDALEMIGGWVGVRVAIIDRPADDRFGGGQGGALGRVLGRRDRGHRARVDERGRTVEVVERPDQRVELGVTCRTVRPRWRDRCDGRAGG